MLPFRSFFRRSVFGICPSLKDHFLSPNQRVTMIRNWQVVTADETGQGSASQGAGNVGCAAAACLNASQACSTSHSVCTTVAAQCTDAASCLVAEAACQASIAVSVPPPPGSRHSNPYFHLLV
jgi:hypothetical protein